MKKKIFSALTLGLLVGGVGFISSCKDYDDDLRTEMNSQIASMDQKVDSIVQNQIEDLKKEQQNLLVIIQQMCKCEENKPWQTDLTTAITNVNNTINSKFDELNGKLGEVEGKILTEDQIREIVLGMGYYSSADVDKLIKNLQDQIDALNGASGSGCTCDLDAFKTSLISELDNIITQKVTATVTKEFILNLLGKEYSDMLDSYITAEDIKNFITSDALDKYVTKEELAAQITGIATNATAIAQLQQAIEDLEPRVKAAEETLKTHGDDIEALKKVAEDLQKADEQLAAQIKDAKDLAESALKAAEAAQKAAEDAQKAAEAAQKTADEALDKANANADAIVDLQKFQNTWEAALKEWKLTIPVLTTAIEGLTERVAALENRVDAVESDLNDVRQRANDAYEKAESNYVLISTINNVLDITADGESNVINAIKAELAEKATKEELKEVKDLAEQLKTDLNNLTERVDGIDERLKTVEEQVDKNTKAIAQLVKDIEALKKMITSIEIQATKNPLFGSIYLPTGFQTNIVALWYGEALNDGKFPTYNKTAGFVFPESNQPMINGEYEIAGNPRNGYVEFVGGDILMDESEGNAGTVYVTVNPTNVDFTGTDFSLVNSLDEQSAFKLGDLKASEERLQYGITRGATNGFYEAPVTLAAADVEKVNVKLADGLKSAVKDVVENATSPSNINTNKVASAVKEQFENLRTDALGLKSWVEADNRGVYSKYGIAGVSIKNPITYSSFKDFNYSTLPGYERAVNFINTAVNTVNDKVKFNIGGKIIDDINAIEIKKLEDVHIKELTDQQLAEFVVEIDTTIHIDGLKYTFDIQQTVDVPVKFDEHLEIPIDGVNASVTVPVNISKEVSVDLSKANVTTPTVVVTTSVSSNQASNPNSAVLLVPLKDKDGNPTGGYCEVPLNELEVEANASLGEIKIGGEVVGKLEYKEDIVGTGTVSGKVGYVLKIDKTVQTTIGVSKTVALGQYNKVFNPNKGEKTDYYKHYDKSADNYYALVDAGAEGGDVKTVRIFVAKDLTKAIKSIWSNVTDVEDMINSTFGTVNGMLDQLQTVKNDAQDLLDEINGLQDKITDAVDEVADRLKSYIDKINNRLVSLINSANDKLQPFLLVSDNNGTHTMSQAKTQPTKINGSLTFYATNYLAEVVAPAYKRHIAVTGVYNPDGSKASNAKSLAQSVNNSGDMNKVIDGKQIRLSANGFQKGYIYEVAYSALDYTGKQVTHKYYVRVK